MFQGKVQKILHAILRRLKRVFYSPSFEEAKKSILTDYAGFSSDYRWKIETKEELLVLRKFIQDDFVICDFGAGIGRISREILKEFPQVRVVAVDSSKSMLKYYKQFIPSIYHNRIQILHVNKMKQIKTNSVDFAFSIYVLQHIPASQFEQVLEELKRIIKPEGSFYVLNWNQRYVIEPKRQPYDDGLPQLEIISKHFETIQDVQHESAYMKKILETHFSKLFRPKKH